MKLLIFLDYFFLIFHTLFTCFSMAGWAFKKTRRIHLAAILVISFSWFILGIWYGWGYCLCTDWHWQVREALGKTVISNSYIHFLVLEITGIEFPEQMLNIITLAVFISVLMLTVALNIRDILISRKNK